VSILRCGRYSDGPHDLCAANSAKGATVGYLAGFIAIAFVVFGWPYWPVGWILIAALLAADFVLET
jgi:hypothetical protein